MLLRLDGERLAESYWFLGTSTLKTVLSKDVTEFIGIGVVIGTVIGIHADLIIQIKCSIVAHVKLICDV